MFLNSDIVFQWCLWTSAPCLALPHSEKIRKQASKCMPALLTFIQDSNHRSKQELKIKLWQGVFDVYGLLLLQRRFWWFNLNSFSEKSYKINETSLFNFGSYFISSSAIHCTSGWCARFQVFISWDRLVWISKLTLLRTIYTRSRELWRLRKNFSL